MKKLLFLLLLLIFVAGCSARQSLIEGAVMYEEALPELGSVSFSDESGAAQTVEAYPGLIYIYAQLDTEKQAVESAVTSSQGAIVSAMPAIGVYMVKVEAGQESAFISAMQQQSWVVEAHPAFPIDIAEIHLFDRFSGIVPPSNCLRDHGDLTGIIAGMHGSSVTGYEIRDMPTHVDMLLEIARVMESASGANQNKVFSFSLQSHASYNGVSAEELSTGCHTIKCQTVRDQQKIFLRGFMSLMELAKTARPDVADKAMFVIATGNAGVDFDMEIKELKQAYPNAFSRIKLVGSSTADGEISHRMNYASDTSNNDVVYALGENKYIPLQNDGEMRCSGTSFSTPEISGLLDYIWSLNPQLTSEQVMKAFDQALAEYNTRVVPHDRSGFTGNDFIDRVMGIASGRDKQANAPSEKEKGSAASTFTFEPPTMPSAREGEEYSYEMTGAQGGTPPYIYMLDYREGRTPPTGLKTDDYKTLTWTPELGQAGEYTVGICAKEESKFYSSDGICKDVTIIVESSAETWTGEFKSSRFVCNDYGEVYSGKLVGTFTATIKAPKSIADALRGTKPGYPEYEKGQGGSVWSGSETVASQCTDRSWTPVGGTSSNVPISVGFTYGIENPADRMYITVLSWTESGESVSSEVMDGEYGWLLPGGYKMTEGNEYVGGQLYRFYLHAESITDDVISGTFGDGTFTLRKVK